MHSYTFADGTILQSASQYKTKLTYSDDLASKGRLFYEKIAFSKPLSYYFSPFYIGYRTGEKGGYKGTLSFFVTPNDYYENNRRIDRWLVKRLDNEKRSITLSNNKPVALAEGYGYQYLYKLNSNKITLSGKTTLDIPVAFVMKK